MQCIAYIPHAVAFMEDEDEDEDEDEPSLKRTSLLI